MSDSAQIHWYEGLFLQPHHLQAMQRHLAERTIESRQLAWAYPYGVVESRLNSDALGKMMVQFERLRVVMPHSGLDLQFPENADLPAMHIKKAFESSTEGFVVRLGVPLWHAKRPNTIDRPSDDDSRIKKIFRTSEVERYDENDGEKKGDGAMLVRKINARLMLEDEDDTDMETIPLLRVVHATGEDVGMPRLDRGFVPPLLVLSGSTVLRDLVRTLADQVEATRGELVNQIGKSGFLIETMRGPQFEQLLRLRTLNRFAARLPQLSRASVVAPFAMYLELRELLGELAALYPGSDPFAAPNYDHENPGFAFFELNRKIREFLGGAVKALFHSREFRPEDLQGRKAMVATLEPADLTEPTDYYLAITLPSGKDKDATALTRLVENGEMFKFMPRSVAFRMVRGVTLKEERVPPMGLPAPSGTYFYHLIRPDNQMMWDNIKRDLAIAVSGGEKDAGWKIETSGYKMVLYMILPSTGK